MVFVSTKIVVIGGVMRGSDEGKGLGRGFRKTPKHSL
jgi:ribosome-binding ATPase YchF (GTP1/OBG family)